MEAVKKSIYLPADLDEALRLSAEAAGRSVTKQIEFLLRQSLSTPVVASFSYSSPATASNVHFLGGRQAKPDPKIKKRPSKKLK